VQPFAFLLAGALLLALVAPTPATWRGRLAPWCVFAPAVLGLFLPWAWREFAAPRTAGGEYNFGTLDALRPTYLPGGQALADLAPAIAGAYLDGTDTLVLALWAAAVATLLLASWRRGTVAHSWRGTRLALLALVLYFALPQAIRGQWNIAPRFAWVGAMLIVAAIGDPGPRLARAGPLMAVALTAAVALNAVLHHRRFAEESQPFTAALAAVPRGQRVLSLAYDARSAVFTQWPYLHFVQYVMAFRGGAAAWSLAKSPPFPIRHRAVADFPTLHPFKPEEFRFTSYAASYDYFIARAGPGADRIFEGATVMPVLVQEGGGWRVWRNPAARPPR
jgi:hypothetical protein